MAWYIVPQYAQASIRLKSLATIVIHPPKPDQTWSSYDWIQRKKRNRLVPERANDLVYVSTNTRLIQLFGKLIFFVEWIAEDDEPVDIDVGDD